MQKLLISIPDELADRLRSTIPARRRSKIITALIENELSRQDDYLYQCAVAVEQDETLRSEMKEWDSTLADGLHNETW